MPILQNHVGLHRVRPHEVPNVEQARVPERSVPAKRSTDRLTRNSHMLGKNGNRTERIAGKAYWLHVLHVLFDDTERDRFEATRAIE